MKFSEQLLAGKTAVITGGGSGLGFAMAERFLQLGARVAISGRRESVLREAAVTLGALGEILAIPCDVRDLFQVEELFAETVDRWGSIDILVNNAAANFVSPTEDLTPNAFRVIVDTVLMGTINATLTIGKQWIQEARGGSVLNIVTGYATNGSSFVVPSAAAKAAVQTLTKSLAVEWAKYGVRFNAIAPGQFPTAGAFDRLLPTAELREMAITKIPAGRFGDPEELANLAAFLVSDLSSYITGEVIHIDGGFGLNLAGELNSLDVLSKQDWAMVRKKVRNA